MTGIPCQNRTRLTQSSPIQQLAPSRIFPWDASFEDHDISNPHVSNSSLVMPFTLIIPIAFDLGLGITPHVLIAVNASPLPTCLFIALNPASYVFDVASFRGITRFSL